MIWLTAPEIKSYDKWALENRFKMELIELLKDNEPNPTLNPNP